MISSDTRYFLKLKLNQSALARNLIGEALLLLCKVLYAAKLYFPFSRCLGKYEKLSEADILSHKGPQRYFSARRNRSQLISNKAGKNLIYEHFLKSTKATRVAKLYKKFSAADATHLRYRNEDDDDREGNLLVLKPPVFDAGVVSEKGILYLQYNNSIFEFARLFDLEKLYKNFVLVFEPSSWGYTDISLEILLHGKNNIYVMAQDEIDFDLCKLLDSRIVPIRAGAGDWINPDYLSHRSSRQSKCFDVCMVASWRRLKNHALLFRELAKLGRGLKIALVGYCWEGRTAGSIRAEQSALFPDSLVSIFESVPHEYVFQVLTQSKVALMLSEREGANRGIYEALASDTPVVILKSNRGVNKALIDEGCVFYSAPDGLADTVKALLDKQLSYSVRERLFTISGTTNTWKKISDIVESKEGVALNKDPLIVSTPNLKYAQPEVKIAMEETYTFMRSLLRPL